MSKGRRSIVLVVCFGMNEAFKVESLIVSWMSEMSDVSELEGVSDVCWIFRLENDGCVLESCVS